MAKMSAGKVNSMEELAEVKGALRMLRTIEGIPVHVHNRLDEYREEEKMIEAKENANVRRSV